MANTIIFYLQFLILFSIIVVTYARIDYNASLIPNFPMGKPKFDRWNQRGSSLSLGDRIRLTGAEEMRKGMITNNVNIKRELYLELSLDFIIHSPELDGGDGIALWVTEKQIEFGSTFAGPEWWKGLLITFSTIGESKVSLHQNEGRAKFRDGNTLRKDCSFPLKQMNEKTKTTAYLLIESDSLNLYLTNNNGIDWFECMRGEKVSIPENYYIGISAATTSKPAIHDIFKLALISDPKIEPEEAVINRPPLSIIAPLILYSKTEFIHKIIDRLEDDDDLFREINELNHWFSSQVLSLKSTVGTEFLELNFGLDQLTTQINELQKEIGKISEKNTRSNEKIQELTLRISDMISEDKFQPLVHQFNNRNTDLKRVETVATSVSNSVNIVQQNIYRNSVSQLRQKRNYEKNIHSATSYFLYGIVGSILVVSVFLIIKNLLSPHRSRASAPAWTNF